MPGRLSPSFPAISRSPLSPYAVSAFTSASCAAAASTNAAATNSYFYSYSRRPRLSCLHPRRINVGAPVRLQRQPDPPRVDSADRNSGLAEQFTKQAEDAENLLMWIIHVENIVLVEAND